MIDAIITFSIRHRYVVIAVSILLAIAGVWAAWLTPVDAIPDLSENQVIVFTGWKGHGPREIEDQVTYPLALGLEGVGGVRVVRSSSDVGFSMISVIFEDRVSFDEARRRVGERLGRIQGQLPAGCGCDAGTRLPRHGPDLLVYGRRTGSRPGAACALCRTGMSARSSARSRAWPRSRASAGFRTSTKSPSIPGGSSRSGSRSKRSSTPSPFRIRPPAAMSSPRRSAEYVVRGVGWLGASGKAGDTGFDRDEGRRRPGAGSALFRRIWRRSALRRSPGSRSRPATAVASSRRTATRLPAAWSDVPWRKPPGGDAAAQGQDPSRFRAGFPPGVKIVPFYDRTPLIQGVIGTVTGTVVEAMISASLCVLVVLVHLRTSFIVAMTLPLAALSSFLIMAVLRWLGIVDIQANAMSLAGIAISIGVLVDSSIVMAENVMHRLREEFGRRSVQGDVTGIVLPACLAVGRPIVFSIAIMLLSFLPVFALAGIEGKMFHPLAFTKSFALLAVAVLAVTTVPALCRLLDSRQTPFRTGKPSGTGRDRGLSSRALVPHGEADRAGLDSRPTLLLGFTPLGIRPLPGDPLSGLAANGILARRDLEPGRGPGQPSDSGPGCGPEHDAPAAQIPDAAGRGDGHGHADHRAPSLGDRVARRSESARYDSLSLSGG